MSQVIQEMSVGIGRICRDNRRKICCHSRNEHAPLCEGVQCCLSIFFCNPVFYGPAKGIQVMVLKSRTLSATLLDRTVCIIQAVIREQRKVHWHTCNLFKNYISPHAAAHCHIIVMPMWVEWGVSLCNSYAMMISMVLIVCRLRLFVCLVCNSKKRVELCEHYRMYQNTTNTAAQNLILAKCNRSLFVCIGTRFMTFTLALKKFSWEIYRLQNSILVPW